VIWLTGVGCTRESRLSCVAYTGESRLPGIGHTREFRLIGVSFTGEVPFWLKNSATFKILIE
jgi:hypothetical protein